MRRLNHPLLLATLALASRCVLADPVTGLTTFTVNTPARAGEVNGNFTAVKTAVDNSHQRIVTLETELAALRAQLGTPQMQSLFAIAPYVSVRIAGGIPTVVVTGANLQIVNGLDDSLTTNGAGNLIVGYDEERGSAVLFECSIGFVRSTTTPVRTQTQCTAANGTWAINHKSGSHNVVIGPRQNYTGSGGLVAGIQNSITGRGTSVTGGTGNHAAFLAASVSGGENNWAYEEGSSVTGGSDNQAFAPWSAISGGSFNQTTAFVASISGGEQNRAGGTNSSISGGTHNVTQDGNTANATRSSILGGRNQLNSAENGTTPVLP
jgi:hypothetical protein